MIRDRETLATTPAREVALDCVAAGIDAAHPRRVVADAVRLDGDHLVVADRTYDLADYESVLVLGGGKAAAGVAAALEAVLGDRLDGGAVVTDDPVETDRVRVLPGDHPVPSERGVESTRAVLDAASDAGDDALVLAVVTGGASALLAAPEVSLADLQATTDALLSSGATIHEVNAVRKHLSAIKGGRLATAAAPATVVTLAFSDVVGDDLDVIGSGPTVPDPSTYGDALVVLERYRLDVPAPIREHLAAGARGDVPETPGPDDPAVATGHVHVLASGFTALEAAREVAREAGYDPMILSSRVRGEAREAALTHVAVAEEVLATGNPLDPPAVVLSGGETTVTVRGDGSGGPNQEFTLAAAVEFAAGADVDTHASDGDRADVDAGGPTLACVDTDGRDGGTDVAGAVVDADTVEDVAAARDALADNDAGGYLADRGGVVVTGRTGTNVNDLRVLVVPG